MLDSIKRLFEGAGEKLKTYVAISFIIIIIFDLIVAVILFGLAIDRKVYILLLFLPIFLFIELFFSWLALLPLYAIAESASFAYKSDNMVEQNTNKVDLSQVKSLSKRTSCPKCGGESLNNRFCDFCGASLTTKK